MEGEGGKYCSADAIHRWLLARKERGDPRGLAVAQGTNVR